MNFSDRLKRLVAETGKDQKIVAQEAGISPASMTNYLKGRWPKVNELKKLASYFDVTADFLLGWEKAAEATRIVTTVAGSLADALAEDPKDAQFLFNEFVELIARVRKNAANLASDLENIEHKVRMAMMRKESRGSFGMATTVTPENAEHKDLRGVSSKVAERLKAGAAAASIAAKTKDK